MFPAGLATLEISEKLHAVPGGVIIITLIIMEIIIIMAAAMEMAKAPDTASAGKQQKSFSNIVISIFSSIKKPLTGLTAGERS